MATNRVVGPAEYKQIAKQNKVTPRNFDQYFMRQGKNIVYRDQATNPTTGTTEAAAGVAQEAKPQHEIFGNAIMDLLKQYQGIEKYPYAKQGFNAQQEQINRIQASPDQSMVGASPEQQNAVRGAGVSAVQPTVSGAEGAGQTFASRLNTFGDILGQARGLQQQMEQSAQQAKADARTLINNAFATTGGSEFLNMNPKELASLEKTAGLPKDYIHNTVQAIKAREEKLKQEELKSRAPQTMETSGGIFQWNSSTGRWEATGLRGYHPGTGTKNLDTSWIDNDDGTKSLVDNQTGNIIKTLGADQANPQPTFEQFVQDEQNKAGQSFTPEKVASLKMQFETNQPAKKLTSRQNTFVTKLNDSISKNATYLKTVSMRTFANGVNIALSNRDGVSDIAAINQFQKVIDEGAVTRDQDVILLRSAQSLVNNLKTKIKGLERGDKLSDDQRVQMANLVNQIYSTQVKALKTDPYIAAKSKEALSNKVSIDDTILNELEGFVSEQNQQVNQSSQSSQVVEYPKGSGKHYSVDAQGNMTPL